MLAIPNLEKLEDFQLEVSSLVDLFKEHPAQFEREVIDWLTRLEKFLQRLQLPAAGEIAAQRGKLLAASRGAIPEDVHFQGRATARKVREATAELVLRRASERLARELLPHQDLLRRAHDVVRLLVALGGAKALLPGQKGADGNILARSLGESWRAMGADPDLGPHVLEAQSLVGLSQSLIVYAAELTALANGNGNGRNGNGHNGNGNGNGMRAATGR